MRHRCRPRHRGKGFCYEEDVRIPFLIRGPGIEPGSVSHFQATITDLPATIMALAGGWA